MITVRRFRAGKKQKNKKHLRDSLIHSKDSPSSPNVEYFKTCNTIFGSAECRLSRDTLYYQKCIGITYTIWIGKYHCDRCVVRPSYVLWKSVHDVLFVVRDLPLCRPGLTVRTRCSVHTDARADTVRNETR